MRIDPFAPALIIDYDLFCRAHGPTDFATFIARWYAVTALIEAAEAEGRDPFELTVDDVYASLTEIVN
jgi:hypothetical protein